MTNTATPTGTDAAEVLSLYDRYVLPTYRPARVFTRGRGSRLWDAGGREYLDFGAGIAVCGLGHAHPAVAAAVSDQVARLTHVSNLYYTENQARLAERLAAVAFDGKCFFANSGAEANEGLVKFARLHGHEQGRYEVITCEGSFHGRTLAMVAATGQEKVKRGFDPLPEGFVHVAYGDADAVAAAVGPRTAAVLVEPIQGEGGIRVPPPGYLRDLREVCDRAGILMLLDEVQTGMGRTGRFFAHQHEDGVVPDAMSVAKGLGNGLPIGGFVVRRDHADVLDPGSHASTFGGNPVAAAAALAVIDTIAADGFLDRVRATGERLMSSLRAALDGIDAVRDLRGRGMMIGIEFDRPVAPLAAALADDGLLVIPAGERVIRLVPPLVIDDDDVSVACNLIADVACRFGSHDS